MSDKIYLHLLILCGIWSQGIIGTIADEENRELPDILVRQKRVINRLSNQDHIVPISSVSYIVKIRHHVRMICIGSILSHYVAITSAICALQHASEYQILSGSNLSDRGTIYNVTNIERQYGNYPERPADGIALFVVHPPFVYDSHTYYIQLHSEPLLPGTLGTVSGWGYNKRSINPGTRNTRGIRSIVVPIIAHRECVNSYKPHQIEITEKDVCTFHPQQHCGHSDGGAPLVVDGYLAGVHLWTGPAREQIDPRYPEVFAMLQHFDYSQWIRTTMHNIEVQYNHK